MLDAYTNKTKALARKSEEYYHLYIETNANEKEMDNLAKESDTTPLDYGPSKCCASTAYDIW